MARRPACSLALIVAVAAVAPLYGGQAVLRNPIPVRVDDGNSFVVADVNGDGIPDGISAAQGSSEIHVRLGIGDGSFAPAIVSSGTSLSGPIATGDFNGDGKLDLALPSSANAAVYLGNGAGAFTSAALLPVSGSITAMVIADFTGDGKSDLLVRAGSQLLLFAGNGSGGFSSAVQTATTGTPAILTANFNGDSKADLLLASSPVQILISNGDGTFATPLNDPTSGLEGATIADFDGDHLPDYVGVNGSNIEVRLGNGDGTFHSGGTYAKLPVIQGQLGAADLDSDGDLDIIAIDRADARVAIYRNHGNAQFDPPKIYIGGHWLSPYEIRLTLADFDHDGKIDIGEIIPATSMLWIVRGNGDGTLEADRSYPLYDFLAPGSNTSPSAIALCDMNHDGILDAVVVSQSSVTGYYTILVANGDGEGGFLPPVRTETLLRENYQVSGLNRIYLVDFTNDGLLDVAIDQTNAGISVFIANDDETFRSVGQVVANLHVNNNPNPNSAAADFTGDGMPDLLTIPPDLSYKAYVYPNLGNGTFGPPIVTQLPPGDTTFVAADFTGDGKLDLVFGHSELLVGQGDGTFVAGSYSGCDGPSDLAVWDINADGLPDLFGDTSYDCRATGPAAFAAPRRFQFASANLVTGDFNGDGVVDGAATTTIILGDGAGSFNGGATPITDHEYGATARADMDGNGSVDLIEVAQSYIDVLYTNRAPTGPRPVSLTLTGSKASPQYGDDTYVLVQVGASGSLTPIGAVICSVDGVFAGVSRVNNAGYAQCRVPYPPGLFEVGTATITATYMADNIFASASNSFEYVTTKADTALTPSPTSTPRESNKPITYSARLQSRFHSNDFYVLKPTGTLTLHEGSTTYGSVTLAADGSFSFTFRIAEIGEHHLALDYSGDDRYNAQSFPWTIPITESAPTIYLTMSPQQSVTGEPVTFTATFPDETSLTGTVNFRGSRGSYAFDVGTASVVGSTATLTTSSLPWGYLSFQAYYSGDANHLPSVSTGQVYGTVSVPSGVVLPVVASADPTFLSLYWPSVDGAHSYDILLRNRDTGLYDLVTSTTLTDWSAQPARPALVYKVIARDSSANAIATSKPVLVVALSLMQQLRDVATGSRINAAALLQLATIVNTARSEALLGPFSFTVPPAAGSVVRASQINELRAAFSEACSIFQISMPVTDPSLAPGATIIKAVHVLEMRNLVGCCGWRVDNPQ